MRLLRLVLRLLVIVEVADNLLGLSPGLYAHNYIQHRSRRHCNYLMHQSSELPTGLSGAASTRFELTTAVSENSGI